MIPAQRNRFVGDRWDDAVELAVETEHVFLKRAKTQCRRNWGPGMVEAYGPELHVLEQLFPRVAGIQLC